MWSNNTYRSAVMDDDIVDVKWSEATSRESGLKKGKNKILVKVVQGTGGWGFYFRITDMKGKAFGDLNYSTGRIMNSEEVQLK